MQAGQVIDKETTGKGSISVDFPAGVSAVFWTVICDMKRTCVEAGSYYYGVNCTGHEGCWWSEAHTKWRENSETTSTRSGISILNR